MGFRQWLYTNCPHWFSPLPEPMLERKKKPGESIQTGEINIGKRKARNTSNTSPTTTSAYEKTQAYGGRAAAAIAREKDKKGKPTPNLETILAPQEIINHQHKVLSEILQKEQTNHIFYLMYTNNGWVTIAFCKGFDEPISLKSALGRLSEFPASYIAVWVK